MSNTITGRVISTGVTQTLPSNDPNKPFVKRVLTLDCTRHDTWTGERSPYENTPQLEFVGERCRELDTILPGDIVTVSFDIFGTKYIDKTTKQERIFTRIKPYKIESVRSQQQPEPQPQQQAQPTYQQTDAFAQQGDPFAPPFDEPPF